MAHLTETDYDRLETQHGRIGVVHWDGCQLVWRKPTREEVRAFRAQIESPSEKTNAHDLASQVTMLAFNGEQDATKARLLYGMFLADYPDFTSSAKYRVVFNQLFGRVEADDVIDLGKGAFVRPSRRATTPKDSQTGSDTSSTAERSPTTAQLPPS